MWILLFSEVTLFENNVLTILSPIVALKEKLGYNVDTGETAVHGCHCPGDMIVRICKVLALPRSWLCVLQCSWCTSLCLSH